MTASTLSPTWQTERRLLNKTEIQPGIDGCWLWVGAKDMQGYGQSSRSGKLIGAHRLSYETWVGPIPTGLDIDHLCRVPNCINPRHLEPVTRSENARRGVGPSLARERQLAITHCPQGHRYTEENTLRDKRGHRSCRTCKNTYNRKYMRQRYAEAKRSNR